MTTDLIELRQLMVRITIGVHPWEQRVRQTLYLDVTLPTDAAAAARTDALADALDYSAVADYIREQAAHNTLQLIESFAETLAEQMLQHFQLPWLRLTLHKPGAVADCQPVQLVIERRATG